MPTIDEWRDLLADTGMTDKEVDEFVQSLRTFLSQVLDEYFRDEFAPDELQSGA